MGPTITVGEISTLRSPQAFSHRRRHFVTSHGDDDVDDDDDDDAHDVPPSGSLWIILFWYCFSHMGAGRRVHVRRRRILRPVRGKSKVPRGSGCEERNLLL